MTDTDGPRWQKRVVDRSLKRAEDAARARTLGPSTRTVRAALDLAAESGSTGFTVQQVVDRAGVALQTFYRHFGNKDALMLALVEEASRAQYERIESAASKLEDPIERLRAIVMMGYRLANRAVPGSLGAVVTRELRRLEEEHLEEVSSVATPYVKLIEETVVAAADQGALHPEDPHRDAELILGIISARFQESRTFGRPESDVERSEQHVWRFCLRALGAAPEVLAEAAASPSSVVPDVT